jgi:hypothetical protein
MSVYLKRALQGGFRSSADQLGDRYDPQKTTSDITTRVNSVEISNISTEREDIIVDGKPKTKLKTTSDCDSDEFITVRGWEQIGPE